MSDYLGRLFTRRHNTVYYIPWLISRVVSHGVMELVRNCLSYHLMLL